MATDTAFALGVLAVAGRRASQRLRAFVLTVVIADDIGVLLEWANGGEETAGRGIIVPSQHTLATLRRDGRPYTVPVWFLHLDDSIWIKVPRMIKARPLPAMGGAAGTTRRSGPRCGLSGRPRLGRRWRRRARTRTRKPDSGSRCWAGPVAQAAALAQARAVPARDGRRVHDSRRRHRVAVPQRRKRGQLATATAHLEHVC